MFPELPSFDADEAFLRALGRAGGMCDCGNTDDGPESLGDSAAGWPIFGQFLAHDITADRSILRTHVDTAGLRNARSTAINLECLYGDGPTGHPFLYQRTDPACFLLAPGSRDLQRNAQGLAIIGDPRNDSHALVSQMHLAFLKAHNTIVYELRAKGIAESLLFDEAARLLQWHVQWLTLHEFLPSLVGGALVEEVLQEGSRWFRPNMRHFIPLEFAGAAYRYGHSQIRNRYRINGQIDPVPLFPDLLGFRPVPPDHTVDWRFFFDTPGATPAQRSRKINVKLVRPLLELPVAITGVCALADDQSLAVRDLQRGLGTGLPSGEAVARQIGLTPLNADQVGLAATGWRGETPLWYYVLREADVATGGRRLGPVGGTIVTEVLVGLIAADPTSYFAMERNWRPRKTMAELLSPRGCPRD